MTGPEHIASPAMTTSANALGWQDGLLGKGATKLDNLNLIPWSYMREGENQLYRLSFDIPLHAVVSPQH